jgi:hypothetical protein
MPTERILALLIEERDKLNRAIEALQGPTKRRGRPPKNSLNSPASPEPAPPAKKKRRKCTAAQRKGRCRKNVSTVGCEEAAAKKTTKKS